MGDVMESLQGRRIAIIGGAGFIGHHLGLELVRRGAKVYAIDGLQVNNLLSLMTDGAENRDLYTRMVNERIDLMRKRASRTRIRSAPSITACGRSRTHSTWRAASA
jgi:nucleoside-diphosphate-sugar epimerase